MYSAPFIKYCIRPLLPVTIPVAQFFCETPVLIDTEFTCIALANKARVIGKN